MFPSQSLTVHAGRLLRCRVSLFQSQPKCKKASPGVTSDGLATVGCGWLVSMVRRTRRLRLAISVPGKNNSRIHVGALIGHGPPDRRAVSTRPVVNGSLVKFESAGVSWRRSVAKPGVRCREPLQQHYISVASSDVQSTSLEHLPVDTH
jgi:hypothetical protein